MDWRGGRRMFDRIGPAHDQRTVASQIFIRQKWDFGTAGAGNLTQMKGIMPRIIAVSEPLRIMHDGLE